MNGKVDILFVVLDFIDGDGDFGLEGNDLIINIDMFDFWDGFRILVWFLKVEDLGV